jgi:AcrR family transcriptional regulator
MRDTIDRVSTAEPAAATTVDRILDACAEQAVDVGLRRVTMEDVARRAGLARVTLYAHFPSKRAVLDATFAREVERFNAYVARVVERFDDPGERIVQTFVRTCRGLRANRIVGRALRSDPAEFLALMAGDSPVMADAIGWCADHLRAAVAGTPYEAMDADATAEVLTRLAQSLLISPPSGFDLDSDEGAAAVARAWILPGVHASMAAVEP